MDILSIQIQTISYRIILQCGGNTLLVQLVRGYLALKPSNTIHLEIQIQRAVLVMSWIHTQS